MERVVTLPPEMARGLVARRQRVAGQCVICGQPFGPSYAARRYCSNRCRQQAKYARRRGRPPA